MITYHDAFAKANNYLDDANLPVVITLHGRFSQGWYFCFEAREFFETGDEAARFSPNIHQVCSEHDFFLPTPATLYIK